MQLELNWARATQQKKDLIIDGLPAKWGPKTLLKVLAEVAAGGDGIQSQPSLVELARVMKCKNTDTVTNRTKELERDGYIEVDRHPSRGAARNIYFLRWLTIINRSQSVAPAKLRKQRFRRKAAPQNRGAAAEDDHPKIGVPPDGLHPDFGVPPDGLDPDFGVPYVCNVMPKEHDMPFQQSLFSDDWLGHVEKSDLSNARFIESRFRAAVDQIGLAETAIERDRVFAAAASAVRKGRIPGAMFRRIVEGRHWDFAKDADTDVGRMKRVELDRAQRGTPDSSVAIVAAALSVAPEAMAGQQRGAEAIAAQQDRQKRALRAWDQDHILRGQRVRSE